MIFKSGTSFSIIVNLKYLNDLLLFAMKKVAVAVSMNQLARLLFVEARYPSRLDCRLRGQTSATIFCLLGFAVAEVSGERGVWSYQTPFVESVWH